LGDDRYYFCFFKMMKIIIDLNGREVPFDDASVCIKQIEVLLEEVLVMEVKEKKNWLAILKQLKEQHKNT